jgi:hypothetical protein
VTGPPPALPGPGDRAPPGRQAVSRILRTDELPDGVDALGSADGTTIIVRASLDGAARQRAVREVNATIRRSARLASLPAADHVSYRSP